MIAKAMKKSDRTLKRYNDLVGIDFSTTATKVVRIKKTKGGFALAGIDLLPAVDYRSVATRLDLPRNLSAYYACLAYSGPSAIVRMVNAPLDASEEVPSEAKLRELINVDDDFRVAALLVRRGKGRQDSSLLAAAMPQDDARFLLGMFPSGPPAPASIEVAGLSVVSALLHAQGAECSERAVCLLEAGEHSSYYAFLNRGTVVLVGRMPFGARILRQKLAADLSVDEELAGTILLDRSINVSSSLADAMAPFLKQLSISKDFIERHQGCRVARIYVSGGLSLLPAWTAEVGRVLHMEVAHWNPFENLQCLPDALPRELEAQATRFASAVGAALGGMGQP